MSDVVRVRYAEADDWQSVRETRLAALADAPHAFGSTLAREVAFDDQEWQRRIHDNDWFLAWSGQRPVGVVAGVHESGHRDRRHLTAMWVHPDHRGTVAATDLVEAVCDLAMLQGATLVILRVADSSPRARAFYERRGFRTTGQRGSLPSAPEIGEELLQRYLEA
ncbi:MAG: GNAT family N-acetyltransferase [Allobranchiibius sp.]|nr:GNAT family N-acetyltransferase [Actinomycetota bacterium]